MDQPIRSGHFLLWTLDFIKQLARTVGNSKAYKS